MSKSSGALKFWRTKRFSISTWLILCSVLVLAGFLVVIRIYATAATLYLSPASATVNVGSNFSVAVRVNTGGDAVNAVQANLSYPASLLDFVSISGAGSAFEIQAESSGGNGQIRIGRGTVQPVSGDALVATITLKGKASGTATVSFNGDSAVVRSSDSANILSSTQSGTYTVQTPPNPPPPPPPPPPGSPPPPPPSPGAPPPSPAAPNNSPGASPGSPPVSPSGAESGSGSGLNTTQSGTEAAPTSLNSQAKQKVQIVVVGLIGQPIEGAEVTLAGETKVTDVSGTAVFDSTPAGTMVVNIKTEGRHFKQTITVKVTPGRQTFQIRVAPALVRNIGLAVLALILITAAAASLILIRRRWALDSKPGLINSAHPDTPEASQALFPTANPAATPGMIFHPQPKLPPSQNPPAPPPV